MSMTSGSGIDATGLRARVFRFFNTHPQGRFLLCIHTHADVSTGQLCNSWNQDGTVALYNTIEEVCDHFLGVDIVAALKTRTSLRGLLLLACGASVGPNHIKSVNSLVDKYVPSLYISFSSADGIGQEHSQFRSGVQRGAGEPWHSHAICAPRARGYLCEQRPAMECSAEVVYDG